MPFSTLAELCSSLVLIFGKNAKLNLKFWKDIKPENKKLRTPKRKKAKLENVSLQNKCANPFHFLVRHSNLSQQRPTKCPCRNVFSSTSRFKTQSIIKFLHKFPILENDKGRPNPFQLFSSTKNYKFQTRTDAIRSEHDRGKKRKKSDS